MNVLTASQASVNEVKFVMRFFVSACALWLVFRHSQGRGNYGQDVGLATNGFVSGRSLWFALAHEGFRVFSGSDDGAGGLQRWRRTPGGTGRNANASVA
ncbi:MAG: hypothetical protein OSB61_11715 [Verrucomicrobiota bacterium]|nr:hypothetical protein [Verrucomicrobiota bacterium]